MKSIDYKFEGLGIEVMIWTVKFLSQKCLSEGALSRQSQNRTSYFTETNAFKDSSL